MGWKESFITQIVITTDSQPVFTPCLWSTELTIPTGDRVSYNILPTYRYLVKLKKGCGHNQPNRLGSCGAEEQ